MSELNNARGLGFGRALGALSGAAGVALLAAVVSAQLSQDLARRLPVFPFFDRIARFHTPPAAVAALTVAGLLMVVAAWGLFSRRRFVTWFFPAAGWIGFLVTLAAAWPREHLWNLLDFGLKTAQNAGRLPATATVYDLLRVTVPGWVWPTLVLALVAWVLLLVAGTVYLRRNRDLFPR